MAIDAAKRRIIRPSLDLARRVQGGEIRRRASVEVAAQIDVESDTILEVTGVAELIVLLERITGDPSNRADEKEDDRGPSQMAQSNTASHSGSPHSLDGPSVGIPSFHSENRVQCQHDADARRRRSAGAHELRALLTSFSGQGRLECDAANRMDRRQLRSWPAL